MKTKLQITNRIKFPKCLQPFAQIKGICVGGCINPYNEIGENAAAHAHPYWFDPHQGWICLRYKYQLKERLTLLHEMAHLIANTFPSKFLHGKEWKKAVKEIGGTFKEYCYARKNRDECYHDYTHRHR